VKLGHEDPDFREVISPLEARRMGRLLKRALWCSAKALKEAGVAMPDAIITATDYGCMENSESFLEGVLQMNDAPMRPVHFMQSTHNTIGSNTAIYLKCHGYNITYVQGSDSFKRAMRKAELLIKSGKCNNVLVGLHNETTQRYRDIMHLAGRDGLQPLISLSVVVKRKNQ
jgi:3-oxoacyl-(acyl-carrier-protein) synthase